ncbi:hypothetical protein [Lysobacter soli]|uniref:hypothetical protein n=1 Tax=Lysobacter soli TaxID=453783 RepID=UPI00240FBC42|nr:hypothetical protein [Lysobacter soli]MDG2518290.1 hypothetical protein [Lysobacter soli]
MSTFETLPFYRGVSDRYPADRPSIHTPRLDRRPRNSAAFFHTTADEWFHKKFGIRYRSQGLLLTSRFLSASTYAGPSGRVMRILPLSHYRFCWSPNVSDLLFTANQLAEETSERIGEHLDSLNFVESDLIGAHECGHEVMLHCDRYVAIPTNLLDLPSDQDKPRILLPA